jgi:hypothetical protein
VRRTKQPDRLRRGFLWRRKEKPAGRAGLVQGEFLGFLQAAASSSGSESPLALQKGIACRTRANKLPRELVLKDSVWFHFPDSESL